MIRVTTKKLIFASCLGVFLFVNGSVFAGSENFKEAVLEKAKSYQQSGKLFAGERQIYAPLFAGNIYEINGFKPLWNSTNRKELFRIFADVFNEGLKPDDYHFSEIDHYLTLEKKSGLNNGDKLELDLLLTEGLVRVLYNLAFGKVDPVALDPNINFTKKLAKKDLASTLLEYIQKGDIEGLVNLVRPQHPHYNTLKTGLAKYREIKASGGWGVVPEGKTLKPGDIDKNIEFLRKRLTASGQYIQQSQADNDLYDDQLKSAVESFQEQHGLKMDGVVGPATLAALNVTVDQRLDQIKVNLERLRWYHHQLKGEFIIVNIASFKALWIKDGSIFWEEIVQVGKDYTSTPVFADEMKYLEFNPTWTIPPGIINRSILPNLKKDSAYLTKKGYQLLSQEGKILNAEAIDWTQLKGFPYIVRQPPGPDNALGLVKFMFPNAHYVYLHDTNHRELFDRERRTFSSGCIRVRNPFDLAEKLLRENDGWDRKKIDEILQSGKTTRVNLKKSIPIIIGYATAIPSFDGRVQFFEDVYKRDQKVLKGLNSGFTVRKQDHP